ncbi:hypothetical protein PMAYCL1PPCAC_17546, partial [Pristionchus mayeri]
QDAIFTHIKNEDEFILVCPFLSTPIFETLSYPVDEELVRISPLRYIFDIAYNIHLLLTSSSSSAFARHFEHRGSGYRKSLLMRRAINEAVKRPEMESRLAEVRIDSTKIMDDSEKEDSPFSLRLSRRTAAAAIDGRTPYGWKRSMQPRRLFREEDGGVVKRRK